MCFSSVHLWFLSSFISLVKYCRCGETVVELKPKWLQSPGCVIIIAPPDQSALTLNAGPKPKGVPRGRQQPKTSSWEEERGDGSRSSLLTLISLWPRPGFKGEACQVQGQWVGVAWWAQRRQLVTQPTWRMAPTWLPPPQMKQPLPPPPASYLPSPFSTSSVYSTHDTVNVISFDHSCSSPHPPLLCERVRWKKPVVDTYIKIQSLTLCVCVCVLLYCGCGVLTITLLVFNLGHIGICQYKTFFPYGLGENSQHWLCGNFSELLLHQHTWFPVKNM